MDHSKKKRSRGRPRSGRNAKRAESLEELLDGSARGGARGLGRPLEQMIAHAREFNAFLASARKPAEQHDESEAGQDSAGLSPQPSPQSGEGVIPITEDTVRSWGAPKGAGLIRISADEMQNVEWLWAGRIPMAKCTLLVGDPDAGKSFITLDLAARVTRGLGVPPEEGLMEPGSVLLLSADDHIRDTIVPRLCAAGADLDRIALLPRTIPTGPSPRPSPQGGEGEVSKERLLSLATDIDRLEQALAELRDCRLVVIDPISAYLKGVDTYNNITVRHHLLKLSNLAERYGAAFLLVSHQRKSAAATALYRAIGSLAFTAVSRVVLVVTSDQTVAGRRLLLPVKMTLQTAESGRAFSIVPCENVSGQGRVEWEPEVVPYTADERDQFVKSGEASIDAVREAVAWLKELLPERDQRMPAVEIQRLARAKGIPKSVLWAAKKQACIKAVHDGPENKWYWERIVSWYHGMIMDDDEWEVAKKRAGL